MDTFGRFKEDQGVRILRKSLQIARCLPSFSRKESLKGKAIGGKPRKGQRGYGSRGARQDTDVDASCRGLVNQAEPGVGNGGHSSIGNHDDARTRPRLLDNCRGLSGLIVVVEADELRTQLDSHSRGQGKEAARVFGSNNVRLLKCGGQARGNIAHIANRGGRKKD